MRTEANHPPSAGVPVIRGELPVDRDAVLALNQAAFGGDAEGRIVAGLWRDGMVATSLVAELGGEVVGHIMFSPVTVRQEVAAPAEIGMVGLGPMSVLPTCQRAGIGGRLIVAGLDACRQLGFTSVCVLGHPDYYPRFGFVPASEFQLGCIYPVPDPVFMVLELIPGRLSAVSGIVHYAPSFAVAAD